MLLKTMQVLVMLKFYFFFNLEPQLKDTKSAITNKLKKLLSELRRFEFLAALVLVFKNIKSDDKTKCDTFYSNSK